MGMFELIQKMFGKNASCSKDVAKERLRVVLVHDRVNGSPQLLETLKDEMFRTISNYMDIDEDCMEVSLTHTDSSVTLVANIPVTNMKRGNMPRR